MSIGDAYVSGGTFGDAVASDRPHRFASVAELEPYKLLEGLTARAVHGERITLAVVDLAPNLVMAEHRHHNEQVGIVIRGEFSFTVGGETQRRRAGDMWVIPAGIPHIAATGEEGCTLIECFSPPRDDWEGLSRLEPTPGNWPD
jgi:quercetin dioxygenase-like cupin family protein